MTDMNEPDQHSGIAAEDREGRLGRAFVALADTLTSDYDLVELLQLLVDTCTDLLDTAGGGLLLADAQGRLQLVASTSEQADLVELVQIGAQNGPCFDCFASGTAVTVPDLRDTDGRWSSFTREALAQGFASVHATPMRLRNQVIGTMNLLDVKPRALAGADIAVAQALTDVATIGILQARLLRESTIVAEQLHSALSSRVLIEQAKGVLSATTRLSIDDSFRALRAYARRTNTPLRTVAAGVVDRTLDVTAR